jgi:hypothetical protein
MLIFWLYQKHGLITISMTPKLAGLCSSCLMASCSSEELSSWALRQSQKFYLNTRLLWL